MLTGSLIKYTWIYSDYYTWHALSTEYTETYLMTNILAIQ